MRLDYTAVVFCLFVVAAVLWLVWPLRHTAPSNISVETVDDDLIFDPSYRCGAEGCEACQIAEQMEHEAHVQKDVLGSE